MNDGKILQLPQAEQAATLAEVANLISSQYQVSWDIGADSITLYARVGPMIVSTIPVPLGAFSEIAKAYGLEMKKRVDLERAARIALKTKL